MPEDMAAFQCLVIRLWQMSHVSWQGPCYKPHEQEKPSGCKSISAIQQAMREQSAVTSSCDGESRLTCVCLREFVAEVIPKLVAEHLDGTSVMRRGWSFEERTFPTLRHACC